MFIIVSTLVLAFVVSVFVLLGVSIAFYDQGEVAFIVMFFICLILAIMTIISLTILGTGSMKDYYVEKYPSLSTSQISQISLPGNLTSAKVEL